MENLKTYLSGDKFLIESIFDEDDIMSDIDKNVEINKWFNQLSDEKSFARGFDHLWCEIGVPNNEVKKSHMSTYPTGDENDIYMVFQKHHAYQRSDQWKIIVLIPDKNKYACIEMWGEIDIYNHDCYELGTAMRKMWLDNILPRKSKNFDLYARQIYKVSDDYKWVVKLMHKLYEKLK